MISVAGLTRRYGDVVALAGIDFEVPAGQILGFMGPNGAGKTTTLRILAGLLAPTTGTARVAGYTVGAPGDCSREQLGYLPETAPCYEELTVAGYLRFVAQVRRVKLRGVSPRKAAAAAIERCGLSDMQTRPIGTLSKGYRQRVGLAQAILHDPKVLILDEPTSGLDPAQRVAMRAVIRQVGSDRTVIFSSHVMQEVEAVADRVLILNHGRIVADDTPARLMAQDGLWVTVGGVELATAAAQIEALESVRSVEVRSGDLWIDAPNDVAGQIAKLIVEAGWSLQALRPGQSSLEASFIRLTRDG
ncbi:MAG: ABC-2 type transport system ATP-binding protein [Bradymonadia bacterium]|jgi:ABC-2 type transport system ATP-binding protein